MKKVLSKELTLYFKNRFPYKSKTRKNKFTQANKVTIGIGGNIGDVIQRFNHLFWMLQKDARFVLEETSPILKNPPFGYLDQSDFYNAIIMLRTNLSPIESLNAFQKYEQRFKRKRSFKDAPRTLDIDIIFFNNIKIDTKRLTIPHKAYNKRDSVLIPLSYITKLKYDKIKK